MSRYFQRPENAISKAEEFMKVGKESRALDTLYEVIKSKKRSHNFPEKLLEKIMYIYLELCVDQKKSHVAKEGLYQYRNMCQSTNVASLASVVQFYLSRTEKKTESAQEASKASVADIDDLENLSTPEMIMLSAVSGEDAQDRSNRTILMPWVKFLWESYCQCLELLRTNSRVERLYHDIANKAFRFCIQYQRKTEFRKLCEKLRAHLELTLKQNSSPMSINLNNPDTQQLNLDTRLIQLDAAILLELWQEAYKAIEDIHGLMVISKKIYQPKTMSYYYQKVALVYWKSGCHLFHAAAILKHFHLNRDMKKNISQEELSKMASRVLASVLAIPQPSQHPEFDKFIEMDRSPQEKMARLALQLGLQQPPTRASLLKDIKRFGLLQFATPQIQKLHQVLEVEFSPLNICARVQEVIDYIDSSEEMTALRQYTGSLKQVTLVRLLRQVSQSYQSICFNRLLELAPFTDAFSLERMIVDCVRHNDMQIRIDHRSRTIHFGTDLVESAGHDSLLDGPHIQDMPSEQIRNQLMVMMEVLQKSVKTLQPDKLKLENSVLRQKIVESYHQSKQREHERILQRRKTIEDRKEYLEKRAQDLAAEEDAKREQILREQQELEEKRLENERVEREQRKREEEIRQIQQRHIKEKVEQIAQTEIGKKVLDKLDENEIAELDADQIMKRQVIELEKEKRELISRLKSQEKKIDHFERAKRQEEIPLLLEHFKEDQEQDKIFWAKKEEDRIAQLKTDREVALATQERLSRMKEDKDGYLSQLLKERQSDFEKKLKEFNELMEKEKSKRLAERKEYRKAERREKWIKEKKEEEQRARDEELKREREERQRLEREKALEEEKAWQMELDAKEKREKERSLAENSQDASAPYRPPRDASPKHASGRVPPKQNEEFRRGDGPKGEFRRGDGPKGEFRRGDGPDEFCRGDGPRKDFSRDEFGRSDGPRGDFRRGDGSEEFRRGDGPRGDFRRGDGSEEFRRGDGPKGEFRRGDGLKGDSSSDEFRRGDGPKGEFGSGDGPRGYFRRGDRDDFRRGDRDDFRRGDRDDFRRGERDDFRRGDRDDFRRGDRDDFRRGDRDFRRGDGGSDDFRRRNGPRSFGGSRGKPFGGDEGGDKMDNWRDTKPSSRENERPPKKHMDSPWKGGNNNDNSGSGGDWKVVKH